MSLKILGGAARGFLLAAPKTFSTRPTSVLIRRKIFDWRQNLVGHTFIDLFAGSGIMSFEALSRGADEVYLIELNKIAFKTIKKNVEKFQKSFELNPIYTHHSDAVNWIAKNMSRELLQNENTIVFVDPPYGSNQLYLDILNQLKQKSYKGEIWLEGDYLVGKNYEELSLYLELTKTVKHGDHFVLIGKLV